MIKIFFPALLAVLVGAGCISYHYEGKSAAVITGAPVKSYYHADELPVRYPADCEVLGVATASGDYSACSVERLRERLREEARKQGADAVLIVDTMVEGDEHTVTKQGTFASAVDNANTDASSYSLVRTDMDVDFANSRRGKTSTTAGSSNHFRRTLRAEFLKFRKTE